MSVPTVPTRPTANFLFVGIVFVGHALSITNSNCKSISLTERFESRARKRI